MHANIFSKFILWVKCKHQLVGIRIQLRLAHHEKSARHYRNFIKSASVLDWFMLLGTAVCHLLPGVGL